MRTVLEHPGEWFVEWLIYCHDCGTRMGAEYREDVVDAWNSRHAPVLEPDDNPLGGDDPPYVLRRVGGRVYMDGQPEDDCPEGWCVYVRADLPRPGTRPAPDPAREAAVAFLAAYDDDSVPAPEAAVMVGIRVDELRAVLEQEAHDDRT